MLGHHRDVDDAWAAGRPRGCWNRDALRRPREGHARPLGASLNPVAVSQRGTRARGPSQPPFAQVRLSGRLLGTDPGKARSVGARAAKVHRCVPRGAEGGRAPEPHCLHFEFLLSTECVSFRSLLLLLVAQFPHMLNGNNNGSSHSVLVMFEIII